MAVMRALPGRVLGSHKLKTPRMALKRGNVEGWVTLLCPPAEKGNKEQSFGFHPSLYFPLYLLQRPQSSSPFDPRRRVSDCCRAERGTVAVSSQHHSSHHHLQILSGLIKPGVYLMGRAAWDLHMTIRGNVRAQALASWTRCWGGWGPPILLQPCPTYPCVLMWKEASVPSKGCAAPTQPPKSFAGTKTGSICPQGPDACLLMSKVKDTSKFPQDWALGEEAWGCSRMGFLIKPNHVQY